ncbi:MAG: decaprenyl-phosphate phosphoribosyltransferase [bacterium]|nr:decaprenyl-phosphate phosphoribosyltransferase [bacterium]
MQILLGLLRTMRPKQWTKNLLFVFPGIVFDGKLFQLDPLLRVLLAFVLLSLVSGSVYIINDLADIENDRRHPRKKFRPIPSGQLPVSVARLAAVIIPLFAVTVAFTLTPALAVILIVYLVQNVAYSLWLKHVVILDVLVVTAGFILRVAAGVVVVPAERFSPWLYACTGLLALFLIIGKRRQELVTLGEKAADARPIFKDYNLPLIDEMLRVVTTSTLLTYTIYTVEAPSPLLADTNSALLTVPFVMYGLFRYLYLIHVKGEGSAPDEVLLQDRPLQIAMLLFGLTFIVILYVLPAMP